MKEEFIEQLEERFKKFKQKYSIWIQNTCIDKEPVFDLVSEFNEALQGQRKLIEEWVKIELLATKANYIEFGLQRDEGIIDTLNDLLSLLSESNNKPK